MVESSSRFDACDGALLEHLAEYISLALSKQMVLQADMGYRLDRIFSDILSGPEQEPELVEQWFSEFGWLASHQYFCINLKVAALDLENMTVRFVCSHMEKMLPQSCAFQYQNHIVIFVNLTRFGGDAEDVKDKIIYFLRDSFLKAASSLRQKSRILSNLYVAEKSSLILEEPQTLSNRPMPVAASNGFRSGYSRAIASITWNWTSVTLAAE